MSSKPGLHQSSHSFIQAASIDYKHIRPAMKKALNKAEANDEEQLGPCKEVYGEGVFYCDVFDDAEGEEVPEGEKWSVVVGGTGAVSMGEKDGRKAIKFTTQVGGGDEDDDASSILLHSHFTLL